MIELWIPLTIAAAFCQNLRSALQKHLKTHLSAVGAAYVRFFTLGHSRFSTFGACRNLAVMRCRT